MSIRNTIIDNLLTAMEDLKSSTDYDVNVRTVSPYIENAHVEFKDKHPLLMVADLGNEQVLVRDATHERFAFDVTLVGFTKGSTFSETQSDLNGVIAAVKQFINAGPDLGDNVLEFKHVEGIGNQFSAEGYTNILTRITYWCEKGIY